MMLEARALGFGYRGHSVGRDVTFSLSAGEVVCLLGPNGGGKTTLFKTLLGLLRAQAGAVLLDGVSLAALDRGEVARRVGYVPQAVTGYFPFLVEDVVLMGRTAHLPLFATPSVHDREIAREAIARMGLAHLARSEYTRISGGERQLALIARALAQGTPLLVMDEPTASLDFGNQVKVLERVTALAREGIGILMSTHDPDQAFLCGDRVLLLRDGGIFAQGVPAETLTAERLHALYGVAVEVIEVPMPSLGRSRRACFPSLAGR
jgi:iron complex transport system ATP-binding protein